MDWLIGLAYGLGSFVLVTGIVLVVLAKFGAVAGVNSSANEAIAYGMTQLGSGGMLGWLAAIIAIVIGVFFLQYFMGKKSRKY